MRAERASQSSAAGEAGSPCDAWGPVPGDRCRGRWCWGGAEGRKGQGAALPRPGSARRDDGGPLQKGSRDPAGEQLRVLADHGFPAAGKPVLVPQQLVSASWTPGAETSAPATKPYQLT